MASSTFWPPSFFPLSSTRRRMATIIRWFALPLAAFCLLMSLQVVCLERLSERGRVPAEATVLEARVINAARMESEWELWVRYPMRGRNVEGPLRAWSTFTIAKGDTLPVLVDPDSGLAQDEHHTLSWIMVGCGALAAAFFVLVGFIVMGAMLRRDRQTRGMATK